MNEYKIDYCHHDSVTVESRQECIKREDARQAVILLHGGCITDAVKDFIDYTLLSVPTADVVEVSKILKTADEQEKQGFIQTAKVLRELVNDD